MSVLHHIKHIPLEVHFALKVSLVEDLHRDLLVLPFPLF